MKKQRHSPPETRSQIQVHWRLPCPFSFRKNECRFILLPNNSTSYLAFYSQCTRSHLTTYSITNFISNSTSFHDRCGIFWPSHISPLTLLFFLFCTRNINAIMSPVPRSSSSSFSSSSSSSPSRDKLLVTTLIFIRGCVHCPFKDPITSS